MKMASKKKTKILDAVNKVYSRENPSTYFRKHSEFKTYTDNIEKFLLKLKLPAKIFKNSSLLDLGSGSGQLAIAYSKMGAKCVLVEYDKKSFLNSSKLFKKFAKNKYKLVNQDLFKFRTKKKFDFVVSSGVAHHTNNPKKNIEIACRF